MGRVGIGGGGHAIQHDRLPYRQVQDMPPQVPTNNTPSELTLHSINAGLSKIVPTTTQVYSDHRYTTLHIRIPQSDKMEILRKMEGTIESNNIVSKSGYGCSTAHKSDAPSHQDKIE